MATGDATTRLVVLRGNSASGKSTTAKELRRRIGTGVAWVEQDYLRRTLLREHPWDGAPNVGLIDLAARYALDSGYHVVLEGGLYEPHYGVMLRRLVADHVGVTGVYYFQIPFDETARRHLTKPLAGEVMVEQMRQWYQPDDFLGVPAEKTIGASSTLEDTVTRIVTDLTWHTGGKVANPIED
jgi:hypothetical protein